REKALEVLFLLSSSLEVCLRGKEGIVGPLFLRSALGDWLDVPGKTQSFEDWPDETVFQARLFSWAKLEAANVMIGRGYHLTNLCRRFVSFFPQTSLRQAILQIVGREEILISEELSGRGAHAFPSPLCPLQKRNHQRYRRAHSARYLDCVPISGLSV